MKRKIQIWYDSNIKQKSTAWNKSVSLEKEVVLDVGNDRVLVLQKYHFVSKRRWLTVQGFVVEENQPKNYGLNRVYTDEEKESIEETINKSSLEGKIYFDEGGTRIV